MILELSKEWEQKPLENLLEFYIGGDWGKDESFIDEGYELTYCIRGSEIRNWQNDKGSTASLRKIKKQNIQKRKLEVGDILVEISGGGPDQPVGRTVVVDKTVLNFQPTIPKICTNFLRMIRPTSLIDPTFLNFFLRLFYSSGEIVKYQGGSNNLRNLKFPEFLKILIPYPADLTSQRTVVTRIEELFSELDKGIENLKIAQEQLKIYRQSVLKWAFEGRLTNENVKKGLLPEGWNLMLLKNNCLIKRGKSKHRPRNEPALYGGAYPFVQTGDIRGARGGYLKIFNQTYNEKGLAQSKLWPKGTLCITIAANIGETAILSMDACFPDSIVGLICDEKMLLTTYTNYFLISHKEKLEQLAPATAQKNINVDILEKVSLPVPEIQEQEKVVQEIESRLSIADKMDETIKQSLLQVESLRQSILKKAFEGKLIL